ncbi:MAG: transposase, partial [Anaerolineae bacterium]|nr:transposase [Anaerolineae bacterium]
VRRKLNGRNRFYVQLVCEGQPYQKPQNQIGAGVVGLDLGPSTIAAVSEQEAFLEQFCAELEPCQKVIRRLQRKIDRQRRANNPHNYEPDGTIKRGPKVWRKSLHGRMVNRVLRMGDTVQLEKLSYRAFQRCFGRSVGMRAPGTFVRRLKRKAESAGASVVEFPTRTTRLSQTCHNCGAVAKKPLSRRWHVCDCGIVAQRDLYSAFLAMCVEGERLDAGRARVAWPGVDALLQAALSRIEQPANGRPLPSSFGLRKRAARRQSRSPVKAGVNAVDTRDVVPSVVLSDGRGELEKDCRIARTP